jgi:hypothetical protein
MLTFVEKISYFQKSLNKTEGNYYDNFKQDILIFIDEFNSENCHLKFIENLTSYKQIDKWIEKLCSRLVLKFDSESEQINDFIYDYIENG